MTDLATVHGKAAVASRQSVFEAGHDELTAVLSRRRAGALIVFLAASTTQARAAVAAPLVVEVVLLQQHQPLLLLFGRQPFADARRGGPPDVRLPARQGGRRDVAVAVFLLVAGSRRPQRLLGRLCLGALPAHRHHSHPEDD